MASIDLQSVVGASLGTRELPEAWFGTAVNVPLMHQVVVAGAAARRAGTHSTKTRGDVSGGGRKPWRQKGTGRARQGSIRAPQWSGGGVAHGPVPRDHSMRVNKKMRAASLRSALTDASQSGKLALVEDITFDAPSTKDALALLSALALEGKVLLVLPEPNADTELSFRNLREVRIAYPGNLSTYDLLYADRILFTASALDRLTGETTTTAAPTTVPKAKVAEKPAEAKPAAKKPAAKAEAEEPPADEPEDANEPDDQDAEAGATEEGEDA